MAEPPNQGGTPPNRRLMLGVAGLLLVLTLGDIFRGQATVSAQKEVPAPPKFASKFMGPTIKFLYCYS